jgi:hypothetical protein
MSKVVQFGYVSPSWIVAVIVEQQCLKLINGSGSHKY